MDGDGETEAQAITRALSNVPSSWIRYQCTSYNNSTRCSMPNLFQVYGGCHDETQ